MSIVATNTAAQTLEPGQSLVFDDVIMKCGNGECHPQRSGTNIKLCGKGIYDLFFHANIGGTAAGAVQLSIMLGGSPLLETTMISNTAAAGDLNSVSAGTFVNTCTCCCDPGFNNVTVTNTGTTAVTVGANSAFKIARRS